MADHSLWKRVCMPERFMTWLSYATVGPSRSLKVAIVVTENIRSYSFSYGLRGFTVEIVMGNSKRKMWKCFQQVFAWKHTDDHTTSFLKEFCCEVLDHPSYNPDIAINNYYPSLHLKKLLLGGHFQSDEEV